MEGGFFFRGWWNFTKSQSVDSTFIREMRVLVLIYYIKKHFKPFFYLKAFCSTFNSRIGEFDFWCHKQGTKGRFEINWPLDSSPDCHLLHVTWSVPQVTHAYLFINKVGKIECRNFFFSRWEKLLWYIYSKKVAWLLQITSLIRLNLLVSITAKRYQTDLYLLESSHQMTNVYLLISDFLPAFDCSCMLGT